MHQRLRTVVIVTVCFLVVRCVSEEEIGSPLRVAQCRARCVQRFSASWETQKACLQGPDCYMCWENCQLLQSNFPVWGAICSEKGICFPGCQQACQFHEGSLESQQQRAPVIQTRGEEVVRVEGGVARWPRPQRPHEPHEPLVYVVMRRTPGKTWRQITQTLELWARLPLDMAGSSTGTIRVLVVSGEGLVTIYSPAARSGLQGAEAVIRSLGRDGLQGLGYPVPDPPPPASNQGNRINTQILPTTADPLALPDEVEGSAWQLREVSLIHQKVLVIAEVAWEGRSPSGPSQRSVYFVTWEVDGGGLKGNLFTDSTCVTLSLWPDTVYHIQVELVTHHQVGGLPQQSEVLVLDTHRAVAVEFETAFSVATGRPPGPGNQLTPIAALTGAEEVAPRRVGIVTGRQELELVAGVGAAVVVFLVVLVALSWRWRHAPRFLPPHATGPTSVKTKKLVEDHLPVNVCRVFPPVVSVVGERSSWSPESPCRHQEAQAGSQWSAAEAAAAAAHEIQV